MKNVLIEVSHFASLSSEALKFYVDDSYAHLFAYLGFGH